MNHRQSDTSAPRKASVGRTILKVLGCICKGICVLVFCAVLALCGINTYICVREAPRIYSVDQLDGLSLDADCVVVLGASVYGTQLSPMLQDRVDAGIAAYDAGQAPKMLMSGDHGDLYYNEVGAMRLYAEAHGVPTDDIFLDHAGFSTYESMYRARHVFGAKKIIICTQTYHLYRAMYIAEMLGMEVYGVSAETRPYVGQAYYDAREFAARIKDFGYCIFWPEPTFTGDPVDLGVSGTVTH